MFTSKFKEKWLIGFKPELKSARDAEWIQMEEERRRMETEKTQRTYETGGVPVLTANWWEKLWYKEKRKDVTSL